MRNFKLALFLALFTMIISGCGGSIYDSTNNSTNETVNEEADTYDAEAFLPGRWVIIDGEGEAVSTSGEDVLELDMVSAQMTLSNVTISGDTGTALLYYAQNWQAFDGDTYLGELAITSYRSEEDRAQNRLVTLTHIDSDNWRIDDTDGNIITVRFDSASTITTEWNGFTYTTNSEGTRTRQYRYELECSFRRQ